MWKNKQDTWINTLTLTVGDGSLAQAFPNYRILKEEAGSALQLTHSDFRQDAFSLWSSVSPISSWQRCQNPSYASEAPGQPDKNRFQSLSLEVIFGKSQGRPGDQYFTKFPDGSDTYPETYSGLFQRSKTSMILCDLFSCQDKYFQSTC